MRDNMFHDTRRRSRRVSTNEGDRLLTVSQMAKRTGIGFVTMRRLIETGQGPDGVIDASGGNGAARHYRVRVRDLDAWLARRASETNS